MLHQKPFECGTHLGQLSRREVHHEPRWILKQHGLTEQQWRVMRALLENSSMEPWQICETCQLLSPSLAGVLSRMEEMGLVKRKRMESDQRRVLVSITPKSRGLARKMAPMIEAQYAELERALGSELMAETCDVVDRLLARLVEVKRPEGGSGEDEEPA